MLRVVDDDLVRPGTGFDTHPHRDMEIFAEDDTLTARDPSHVLVIEMPEG